MHGCAIHDPGGIRFRAAIVPISGHNPGQRRIPPSWAEAQRLAETAATLERTAGAHNVARWVTRGRRHDLREATNTALATIATLTHTEPAQQNRAPA